MEHTFGDDKHKQRKCRNGMLIFLESIEHLKGERLYLLSSLK